MKELLMFLVKYSPKKVFLNIVVSLLAGWANMALLAIIHQSVTAEKRTLTLLLYFCGLCLFLPMVRTLSSVLIADLIQKAVYDLRLRLCTQVMFVPLRKLESFGTNRVWSILMGDITTISSSLAQLPFLVMNGSVTLGCLVYLTWLYWKGGIAILGTTLLGLLAYKIVSRRGQVLFNQARNERDFLYKHLRALSDGIKEFKMHSKRRKAFLGEQLHTTSEKIRKDTVKGTAFFGAGDSMGQILFFIAIGLMIFALPVISSDITTEIMTGYVLLLLYMIVPLQSVTSTIPSLANGAISFRRVTGLGLDLANVKAELEPQAHLKVGWNELRYDGVTHSYHVERENQSFTMGPIHLTIKPGELVFIVGGNGSGKTTLAKMLVGLYEPESGRVLLDNQVIDDQNRDDFRQRFTTVFSDFYLFEDLLGIDPKKVEAQAQGYLEKLQLDHKVTLDKGNLSTINLSQGQRKRLALLTAYLEDRDIYIFDEWASDQDPVFKEIFYAVLLPELRQRGKTVIAITHDDHYFHHADRIIKLDYGQIEYDYSHDQWVEQGHGPYHPARLDSQEERSVEGA